MTFTEAEKQLAPCSVCGSQLKILEGGCGLGGWVHHFQEKDMLSLALNLKRILLIRRKVNMVQISRFNTVMFRNYLFRRNPLMFISH